MRRIECCRQFLVSIALIANLPGAWAACTTETIGRPAVFISDLHLGLGPDSSKEDFHWSDSLDRFLEAIEKQHAEGADLVILGDLLELWQHPGDFQCRSGHADYGCTVAEVEKLTAAIVKAHAADLARLGSFAARDGNCLAVVPGNHDAALLIPSVWKLVFPSFRAPAEAVQLVAGGIWASNDGTIVAEHGHQISPDVNLYRDWPRVTKKWRHEIRLVRPWGEYFVQRLYNAQEDEYPLVDNLTGSAGVKYRIKARGTIGSVADVARFLRFIAVDSSIRQRIALLGKDEEGKPDWNVAKSRRKGTALLLAAMPEDDVARSHIADPALRAMLDQMIADPRMTTDDEIRDLCDAAARDEGRSVCVRDTSLGQAARSLNLIPHSRVLRTHLRKRMKDFPNLATFIYGHTHSAETPYELELDPGHPITIANSGAFQRLIDEGSFLAAASEAGLTPSEALKDLSFDVLPACHFAIMVTYDGLRPDVTLSVFTGDGRFARPCETRCAALAGCVD